MVGSLYRSTARDEEHQVGLCLCETSTPSPLCQNIFPTRAWLGLDHSRNMETHLSFAVVPQFKSAGGKHKDTEGKRIKKIQGL